MKISIFRVASLLSFMGTLVTIIWMAIDIALFLDVRNKAKKLGVSQNTDFGPACVRQEHFPVTFS